MAHKRMFSKDITTSDAFREMPSSSQALYFHLGMEADDDGFLDNYRGLIRSTNSSEDDLKVLIGKRFLIIFPSKIIAVKHWLINNTIRKDRYTATKHLEEKRALLVKENGSYTELIKGGIPDGNQVETQYRIGKDRIGKNTSRSAAGGAPKYNPLGVPLLDAFKEVDAKNGTYYGNSTQRKACDFLLKEHGLDKVLKAVALLPKINEQKLYLQQITTPYELMNNWVKLGNAIRKSVKLKNENIMW